MVGLTPIGSFALALRGEEGHVFAAALGIDLSGVEPAPCGHLVGIDEEAFEPAEGNSACGEAFFDRLLPTLMIRGHAIVANGDESFVFFGRDPEQRHPGFLHGTILSAAATIPADSAENGNGDREWPIEGAAA